MYNKILTILIIILTSCSPIAKVVKKKEVGITSVSDKISSPRGSYFDGYSKNIYDEFSRSNYKLQMLYLKIYSGRLSGQNKLVYLDNGKFYVRDRLGVREASHLIKDTIYKNLSNLRKKGFEISNKDINSSVSGSTANLFYLKQKDQIILSYEINDIGLENIDIPDRELSFLKLLIKDNNTGK